MPKIILREPFVGRHSISLPFGATAVNDEIQAKFASWGIVGHHGIDFALPHGASVCAAAAGIVQKVGPDADFGNIIVLRHAWGTTLYAHLSEILVRFGQRVKKGSVIGRSGESGSAFGPHLHFGLKPKHPDLTNGFLGFINPAPYFSKK